MSSSNENENGNIITDAESIHAPEIVENKTTKEKVIEVVTSNEVLPSQTSDYSAYNTPVDNFTRSTVEALGTLVHLVDSDEDTKLDMFCYVKCGLEDSDILKKCRGVVFNGSTLVLKAFPYTIECNHTESKNITNLIGNINEWAFFEAHEGALVRVFFFGGKWYLSTHRKLNAFRSKWASRESFGTSFKMALISEEENNPVFGGRLPFGNNILERFQETLDKDKQYMFLIRNSNDNRIVCSSPGRPTVYHVGTFVNGQLTMNENVGIPYPSSLTFDSIDKLLSYVETVSYKDLQGVIGFHIESNKQLKIVHKDYQDLFNARGNEPSIKFRYLQVRMNKRDINMLYHLYPDMAPVFDEYENTIYDIGRSVYRAYVQRFIKKRYVTVPKEEFSIIRECHSWHLADRTENRISLNQIITVLNQQTPTNLNRMIRRFKLEQSRQDDQEVSNRPRSDSVRSNKSFEKSPSVKQPKGLYLKPLNLSENNPKHHRAVKNIDGTHNTPRVTHISLRKPLYKPKSTD
jgi:hypothetical protein